MMTNSVKLGLIERGPGQRRLSDICVRYICTFYGWGLMSGYEDNGQVFIGSNYAGTVRNGRVILDRNAN